jgi:hypothetical protein
MTQRHVPIAEALAPPRLLAAALGDPSTWTTWIGVLKAAYGESLSEPEAAAFVRVSGGRAPPAGRVRELVAVASRRCGKGRMMGALCAYEATLVPHRLAPGETGIVACVSPTREQAKIVQRYALGFLDASPLLRDEVAEVTQTEIRLHNGNVIVTLTSDYRTLRGRSLLLACIDEAAFLRDESSSMPDVEVVRALLPGLSTTGGMLAIMSSPYRQAGILFQRHRDHFGRDDDRVLVVAGPSTVFNPTLDQAMIDASIAADPEAAQAEWLGNWRTDLQTFLPDALIDAAVDHSRPLELPPQDGVVYYAFVDMSSGAHDAAAIAIAHRDAGGRAIVDVVRGKPSPHDPRSVTAEFAALAGEYRCRMVVGDAYAGGWVKGAFEAHGLEYKQSKLTRSELYLEGLPLFSRGQARIPSHDVALREMRLLQRRVAKSGKDSVDHGVGGHDDFANALFGALHLVAQPRPDVLAAQPVSTIPAKLFNLVTGAWINEPRKEAPPGPDTNAAMQAASLRAQYQEARDFHQPGLPPIDWAAVEKTNEARQSKLLFVGKLLGGGRHERRY